MDMGLSCSCCWGPPHGHPNFLQFHSRGTSFVRDTSLDRFSSSCFPFSFDGEYPHNLALAFGDYITTRRLPVGFGRTVGCWLVAWKDIASFLLFERSTSQFVLLSSVPTCRLSQKYFFFLCAITDRSHSIYYSRNRWRFPFLRLSIHPAIIPSYYYQTVPCTLYLYNTAQNNARDGMLSLYTSLLMVAQNLFCTRHGDPGIIFF